MWRVESPPCFIYNFSMKEFDFYIVPTPIGNLGDMTARAVEVLKSVDLIACEDSRVTQKLLNHFDIRTKCVSYHKFNERERVDFILGEIRSGKRVALVSDAGTPLFCDPGAVLVKELRKNGFSITALAGANALATFLSEVSRGGEDFYFAGFLPKSQSQIENLFKKYAGTDFAFYESPNRILKTLEIVRTVRPQAKVALGRELTKVFEEIIVDDAASVIKYFEENVLKGEIVALVFRDENSADIELDNKIEALIKKGFKAREISIILSEFFGVNKNEVYKRVLQI